MNRKRIVVMGFMAGIPIAGVVWQHIHYIVGLQRLGHEVYYIEDSGRLPYNPVAYEVNTGYDYAVAKLGELAAQFGFQDRWAFCPRYMDGKLWFGMSRDRVLDLYRHADAILNVCGSQDLNEDLLQSQRIIYVESDPGVEQIRVDKGDPAPLDYLSKHRTLFTFGENIGRPEFPVPLHNFHWLPTRQPVVTDFWGTTNPPPAGAAFTSIANWNTSGKDIEWRGDRYLWSKSLEFLKFIEAPNRCGETFELATQIADADIVKRFQSNGWRIVDSQPASIDHNVYVKYVHASKGEFTVAKDQYVRLNTGWFSDRSACYLAAGRPVITQDTGFQNHYGGHGGLFAFKTVDDIKEALKAINADYAFHCRAAMDLAAEHFEATKVLASLLDRANI